MAEAPGGEDIGFREADPADPEQPADVTPGEALDFDAVQTCDGKDCCPAEMPLVAGSDAADVIATEDNAKCIVLDGGADKLSDSGKGTFVLAGAGDDKVTVDGAAYVAGGPGSDTIVAIGPQTEINGGEGDDVISTGVGHHIVVPGEGADTVVGGKGSIVVHIRDACELEDGESLTGNGDSDTLVIPVSESALAEMGVETQGFDRIIVAGATCTAGCAPTDCVAEEVVL